MKYPKGLDFLQKISMSLMVVLVLITFLGTNLQAVLWKSSDWLVSTVLPAVVVDLTNDERAHNNASPLRRNAVLDAAAELKAKHMAKNQYFAHYAPDGTSPWYWFDEAGYVYAHAGENLAIHFTDSEEVVEAWMNSPSHRKNIVDGKFTEIGVGTAKGEFDGFKTVYVVQLFGAPAVPPPAPVAATPEPVLTLETTPETPEIEDTNVLAAETTSQPVAEEKPVVVQSEPDTELIQEQIEVAETELDEIAVASEEIETPVVASEDVVTVETEIVSTSSGLAIASITEPNDGAKEASIAGFATRPHLLMEIMYGVLATVIIGLLIASLIMEARRVHPVQVAYSTGMLMFMGLLLWVHAFLIQGAVIA